MRPSARYLTCTYKKQEAIQPLFILSIINNCFPGRPALIIACFYLFDLLCFLISVMLYHIDLSACCINKHHSLLLHFSPPLIQSMINCDLQLKITQKTCCHLKTLCYNNRRAMKKKRDDKSRIFFCTILCGSVGTGRRARLRIL